MRFFLLAPTSATFAPGLGRRITIRVFGSGLGRLGLGRPLSGLGLGRLHCCWFSVLFPQKELRELRSVVIIVLRVLVIVDGFVVGVDGFVVQIVLVVYFLPPRAFVDFSTSALLLVAGLGFGAVLQLVRAWAFRDDPGLLHNNPLLEDLIDDHRGGDLIHIIAVDL